MIHHHPPYPQAQDDNTVAIREAIADLEAGDRGKPFDEFVEEFRRAHQISPDG